MRQSGVQTRPFGSAVSTRKFARKLIVCMMLGFLLLLWELLKTLKILRDGMPFDRQFEYTHGITNTKMLPIILEGLH